VTALNHGLILGALNTSRIGRSLTVLDETGSTNDDARAALLSDAPNGLTIVADQQQRGRGSRGREWQSPAGTDLYLSIVDRPEVAATVLPILTLAVGLAVADTIDHFLGDPGRVAIKWPNDVWIDGRKVSGILIEAVATGASIDGVVIGIGLNVNRTSWPLELRELATSLHQALGRPVERNGVLAALLGHVEKRIDSFVRTGPHHIVAEVLSRLALRGQRVMCDGVAGILLGIASSGALLIDTGHGITEVIAGTLTHATPCTEDLPTAERKTT